MNASKLIFVAASLASLAAPGLASGACSQQTTITNNSNVTMRIVELKSSYSAPFFKSQWTGLVTIPSGDSRTISWTSDLDCTDASGVENHFDVKLIRSNGNTHYCGHLEPGQDVSIDGPDLCFL